MIEDGQFEVVLLPPLLMMVVTVQDVGFAVTNPEAMFPQVIVVVLLDSSVPTQSAPVEHSLSACAPIDHSSGISSV